MRSIDWGKVIEADKSKFGPIADIYTIIFFVIQRNKIETYRCFEEWKNKIPVKFWSVVEELWQFYLKFPEYVRAFWYDSNGSVVVLYDLEMSVGEFLELQEYAKKMGFEVTVSNFIYIGKTCSIISKFFVKVRLLKLHLVEMFKKGMIRTSWV